MNRTTWSPVWERFHRTALRLVLFCGLPAACAGVSLSIHVPSAAPGEVVLAEVTLTQGAQIAGLDMVLSAPDFITLAESPSAVASEGFLVAARAVGSEMQIALAREKGGTDSPASLLLLPLRIAKGAPLGTFVLKFKQAQFYSTAPAVIAGVAADASGSVVAPPADLNGNGLPDAWETRYFGTQSGPADRDFDHDGITDRDEFIAGTDPAATESGLRIVNLQLFPSAEEQGAVVQWLAEEGKNYQIQWSDGLVGSSMGWHEVYRPDIRKNGPILSWTDDGTRTPNARSRERYYRIVIAPETP